MTLEYVLLLIAVAGITLATVVQAPRKAFVESGPRLAARVEKHLATGTGFTANGRVHYRWIPEQP